MLEIVLWILVAAAALILLDQLFLWMEAKGWIYYRKVKRKGSTSGILTGGDVFDPGIRHLENAIEQRVVEEDEDDGDDDGKPKASDRVS